MEARDLDTPAGRLAYFIDRALAANRQQNALEAWKTILEVDDPAGVLLHAAAFSELADRVDAAISGLPDDEDPAHLLEEMPQVRAFIDLFAGARIYTMQNFQDTASPKTVYSLRSCAAVLRRHGRFEPTIGTGDVQKLIELVREVVDEVTSSDLPTDLKHMLVMRLHSVEEALLNIRVAGYEGVEAALDALTFRASKAASGLDEEGKKQMATWITRIWGGVVGFARGAAQIAGFAASTVESARQITGS